MSKKLEQLEEKNKKAELAGGQDRINKQIALGKLTARQRVEKLFDDSQFHETDKFVTHSCSDFDMQSKKILGDGVITALGNVAKREVACFAQDFTVFGGSLSSANAKKICKLMDHVAENPKPLIGLNDSGGARIQEGVESLAGYAEIFYRNVALSGVVPQISLIMGPCAGGAVYSPALTDFVIMVKKTSHMFITGPDVIKEVTREDVTKDVLGSAETHSQISGVAHLVADNDLEAIELTKRLLSYLPSSFQSDLPKVECNDPTTRSTKNIESLIPDNSSKTYDVKNVINEIVDIDSAFEIQADFAKNIVTSFARINGSTVGVVANQPKFLAGCLDISASVKAARFVRFCDSFGIPIITLVDVPGFFPGVQQEHGGIIKHGAKLLYAYAEATVPKVTLILRKAYGGAYDVMASKHLRSDFNYAIPSAEVAVMGPEGAVSILYGKELAKDSNDTKLKDQLIQEYKEHFANPWKIAELGFIDAVIKPENVRNVLANSLELLKSKQRKFPLKFHGNEPI